MTEEDIVWLYPQWEGQMWSTDWMSFHPARGYYSDRAQRSIIDLIKIRKRL